MEVNRNEHLVRIDAAIYAEDLDRNILAPYLAHYSERKNVLDQRIRAIKKDYANGDEEEQADERQIVANLQEQWRQEQGAIAERAMAALARRTETLLHRIKRSFYQSHPPTPPYDGNSMLEKFEGEYQKRFAISLTKIRGFDGVQKLLSGRRGHLRQAVPSAGRIYRSFVTDDQRSPTPDSLRSLVEELKEFAELLSRRLESI